MHCQPTYSMSSSEEEEEESSLFCCQPPALVFISRHLKKEEEEESPPPPLPIVLPTNERKGCKEGSLPSSPLRPSLNWWGARMGKRREGEKKRRSNGGIIPFCSDLWRMEEEPSFSLSLQPSENDASDDLQEKPRNTLFWLGSKRASGVQIRMTQHRRETRREKSRNVSHKPRRDLPY